MNVKSILIFALTLVVNTMYGQQNETIKEPTIHTGDSVTVIAIFNKMNATKDGYYVGEYVVEISAKEAKRLDGKKIKITGVINIVKGLKNEVPEYDAHGNLVIQQGREEDTRHIASPLIEILH